MAVTPASLAKAAPYLLDALQHVTDLLNDPQVGDPAAWKRARRLWTGRARYAIALAEGRS